MSSPLIQLVYIGWVDKTDGREGEGPLVGSVQKLGWSNTTIVVRIRPFFVNEPTVWRIIDVSSGRIDGPFSDTQYEALKSKDPTIASIIVYDAAEAWKRLH